MPMKTTFLALPVLAACIGFAPAAAAQQAEYRTDDGYRTNGQVGAERDRGRDRFGDAGHFAVSAERMFGVGFIWDHVDVTDDDTVTSRAFHLSVLSNPQANVATTYTFPRMGFDLFLIDNLSVGAALGFAWTTFDTDDDDINVFGDVDRIWSFLAAPRIGYTFMVTDGVGIWPRVGVTWLWTKATAVDDSSVRANRFALTFEAPFVFSMTDHVAFLAGPMLDLGIAGSNRFESGPTEQEIDTRTTELGINVGLMVYF